LAAAAKCNLSIAEVLVMFNPFRAVRRGNQSAGKKKKKARPVNGNFNTYCCGWLSWKENPWE